MPGFARTNLISLDAVAEELGVKHVFLKDETSRMRLPSFKILGASWAVFRAVTEIANLPLDSDLHSLASTAQLHSIKLYAATDGNHGRAVARMAKLLGIPTEIYVPAYLDLQTRMCITEEGSNVVVVTGDYDETVRRAARDAQAMGGLLIQDIAWEGYEEIPQVG